MPNWTINDVTFTGPKETALKILEAFRSDAPFNALRPCPEELRNQKTTTYGGDSAESLDQLRAEMKAKYGYESWYDWQIANWGCKWDTSDIQIIHSGEGLTDNSVGLSWFAVRFDTPWGPPDRLLEWLSTQYPDLEIEGFHTQEEDGHDTAYNFQIFKGEWINKGEESLISDESWDDDEEDCPDDPSFRAVTGTATRLPLP
jgi:hypothetical protein